MESAHFFVHDAHFSVQMKVKLPALTHGASCRSLELVENPACPAIASPPPVGKRRRKRRRRVENPEFVEVVERAKAS